MLVEQGYVTLDAYFLEGTKMDANANRYTYVLKKSVEGHRGKLEVAIRELLQQIGRRTGGKYPIPRPRFARSRPATDYREALAAQLAQWVGLRRNCGG